jgi:hypothetical protein
VGAYLDNFAVSSPKTGACHIRVHKQTKKEVILCSMGLKHPEHIRATYDAILQTKPVKIPSSGK